MSSVPNRHRLQPLLHVVVMLVFIDEQAVTMASSNAMRAGAGLASPSLWAPRLRLTLLVLRRWLAETVTAAENGVLQRGARALGVASFGL